MLHDSSNLLNRLFIRFVSVFVYLIIMGLTAEDINKIIERKIAPLEQSLQFFEAKYESLIKKVTVLEKENQNLNLENNALKSQVNTIANACKQLEAQLDEQEQYSRRECLEIKGIPVDRNEDTNEIVRQVADVMDISIQEEDISISHRLPPGKQWKDKDGFVHQPDPPAIIAKFVRRDDAIAIYRSRYKLKGKTTGDIVGLSQTQMRAGNNIYIQESLTVAKRKLFKSCLKVKKELNFKFISTSSGRIFLKKDRSSQSICISSTSDLAKLKFKQRREEFAGTDSG